MVPHHRNLCRLTARPPCLSQDSVLNRAGVARLVARRAPNIARPPSADGNAYTAARPYGCPVHTGRRAGTPSSATGSRWSSRSARSAGDRALPTDRDSRCRFARSSGFLSPGRDGFALVAAARTGAPVALIAAVRAVIGSPTPKHLDRLMEGPFQVAVPGTHQALFCPARGVISGLPAKD